MQLTHYLDKGASLGPEAPCLSMGEHTLSYGETQALSYRVARALTRAGVRPGDHVAILAAGDPIALACVFGIARAGAVWCPLEPRSEAAQQRRMLDALDCRVLVYQRHFAQQVEKIRPALPKLIACLCLDDIADLLAGVSDEPWEATPPHDLAMIVATGGATERPRGVMLSGRNLETMSALTLMGYPFRGRPIFLALAPLTDVAGVLSFPVLALGGQIVIMPAPDLGEFLALVEQRKVTHTFLPPTLIYMLLHHSRLPTTDLRSLQCLWYGGAPMSVALLEEALCRIGPVMAQLFGQAEAPLMISMLAPADHFDGGGNVARERLASAGRPGPLVTVAIMDDDGRILPTGSRGEIVVRSSLVMAGYYKDAAATADAARHGWHHTGDIGYLDGDNYLFIVARKKTLEKDGRAHHLADGSGLS